MKRIGGTLNLQALAALANPETAHRPTSPELLAREARSLAAQGLTHRDIAAALRLAPAAIGALLVADDHPPLSESTE
jgi:hypothetical protein